MFWSMVIPKKLKLVTCSTKLPLIDKLSVGTILGCLKNSINFDLIISNFKYCNLIFFYIYISKCN